MSGSQQHYDHTRPGGFDASSINQWGDPTESAEKERLRPASWSFLVLQIITVAFIAAIGWLSNPIS